MKPIFPPVPTLLEYYPFFKTFSANLTIRECVRHGVFLVFLTGIRPQMAFTHSYTFPIDITLSEFATERVT